MTVAPLQLQELEIIEESPQLESHFVAEEKPKYPDAMTMDLAAHDIDIVIEEQKQQVYLLTTKLNILFVVNGALLTSLMISRLVFYPNIFSVSEVIAFMVNFTLLIDAFLPRQVAVSPNLEDTKFLERYLPLSPEDYQLKMMANQIATYNTNRQRLEDISQSLTYSAYVTWIIAFILVLQVISSYFVPVL